MNVSKTVLGSVLLSASLVLACGGSDDDEGTTGGSSSGGSSSGGSSSGGSSSGGSSGGSSSGGSSSGGSSSGGSSGGSSCSPTGGGCSFSFQCCSNSCDQGKSVCL